MGFAQRMEKDVTASNRPTEASKTVLTAKSVALNAKAMAFLLAPCIIFLWAAGYAVIYGTDYANMPQEKYVVERHRKDAELRRIVAANIAAGNPVPHRETMLAELDTREERTKAWEGVVSACGWSMRRIGYAVLLGVALQVYLTLRLRAHYKKLASGADNLGGTLNPDRGQG